MSQAEIARILEAIAHQRTDFRELREFIMEKLEAHEVRLDKIEARHLVDDAIRSDRGERRKAMFEERKWRVTLALTLVPAALGGLATLVGWVLDFVR